MNDSDYSPISVPAIVSALVGSTVWLGLLAPALALLAVPGIVAGLAARREIHRYGLGGNRFATVGLALSLTLGVLSPLCQYAWYRSEAPPGYERVDFARLTRAKDQTLEQFVGRKVCLKGFALPPHRVVPMSEFLFSPSGSTRKKSDAVRVELSPGGEWRWREEALAVSGTLVRVEASDQDDELPRYILRDSTLRKSRTGFGVAAGPVGEGGC